MKKITLLLVAVTAFIFGCNQTSKQEVKEAGENLTAAKSELKEAVVNENEAAKAKAVADWNYFKNGSDSIISEMEIDLKKMEVRLEKANKSQKIKLNADYEKAKSDFVRLKEKLAQKNVEFENEIQIYDDNVSEKNESFKNEFKHDMDELGKSLKDIFKDNVQ